MDWWEDCYTPLKLILLWIGGRYLKEQTLTLSKYPVYTGQMEGIISQILKMIFL